MSKPPKIPICLTIAGLDPSGGAGIVADIKTFSAFGCYAASAITSITFQNTQGVYGAVHQTAETVRDQIEPIFDDFDVAAVKTGMLPTAETVGEVARLMREREVTNLVVDPVVRSTSGYDLIDDQALKVLVEQLFPIAMVVTPNVPEAERITGQRIISSDNVRQAAESMMAAGAKAVLIKGGHFEDEARAIDHLFLGDTVVRLDAQRIQTASTHGTGCTLSSAIAANLALGENLQSSVEIAKRFVTEAIRSAPNIGHGHSPINQLVKI